MPICIAYKYITHILHIEEPKSTLTNFIRVVLLHSRIITVKTSTIFTTYKHTNTSVIVKS